MRLLSPNYSEHDHATEQLHAHLWQTAGALGVKGGLRMGRGQTNEAVTWMNEKPVLHVIQEMPYSFHLENCEMS